ncbi:unnamed protein product, partial [Effrenium voratum]
AGSNLPHIRPNFPASCSRTGLAQGAHGRGRDQSGGRRRDRPHYEGVHCSGEEHARAAHHPPHGA